MTEIKVLRKWDNSASGNSFSRCGMRAHLQYRDEYFILSEAWPMDSGYENMLFSADKKGNIISYTERWVTYTMQFDEAIEYLKKYPGEIGED